MQARNNDTLINLPGAEPHGWTDVVDDCADAPYMYNGEYWIGYDNEASCELKGKFINFMDFAGAFVWSIDTDDHRGDYGTKFPLLHVSFAILFPYSSFKTTNSNFYMNLHFCF